MFSRSCSCNFLQIIGFLSRVKMLEFPACCLSKHATLFREQDLSRLFCEVVKAQGQKTQLYTQRKEETASQTKRTSTATRKNRMSIRYATRCNAVTPATSDGTDQFRARASPTEYVPLAPIPIPYHRRHQDSQSVS